MKCDHRKYKTLGTFLEDGNFGIFDRWDRYPVVLLQCEKCKEVFRA
jgi:hypothetical protein